MVTVAAGTVDQDIKQIIDKVQAIQDYQNQLVREHELDHQLSWVALIAGVHKAALSTPGEGKSLSFEILSGTATEPGLVEGLNVFSKQLGPTMTFTEMRGMPSITALKEDRYFFPEHGRAWDSHIVILDEWQRANDAFRGEMLTYMVQRYIENDGRKRYVPLISVFGASNSFPEATDAFFDRFLLRVEIAPLSNGGIVEYVMAKQAGALPQRPDAITLQDILALQALLGDIVIPEDTLRRAVDAIDDIRQRGITVSTRRIMQTLDCVRALALLSGRLEADDDDLEVFAHTLWSKSEERPIVVEVLSKYAVGYTQRMDQLVTEAAKIMLEMKRDIKDGGMQGIQNALTYHLQKMRDARNTGRELVKEAAGAGRDVTRLQGSVKRIEMLIQEAGAAVRDA